MKEKYIDRECQHHGIVKYVLEGRGFYRCTKCRQAGVAKRRKRVKEKLVEYKGGKCEICGYDKCVSALEFHHLDPTKKDFGIGNKGNTMKFNRIKEEADKCMLVCSNCHREIHFALDNSE